MGPSSAPAPKASTAPTVQLATVTKRTSMPWSAAAMGSTATARICSPSRVRTKRRLSSTATAAAMTSTTTPSVTTVTPATSMMCRDTSGGEGRDCTPKPIALTLCTTSRMPRLATSFTVAEARRSGQPMSWPTPSPTAAPTATTMGSASRVGTPCSRRVMNR